MTRMRRTRWYADRWPWIWAALCLLLVGVVAVLAVALHAQAKANAAAQDARDATSCLNHALGRRNVPAAKDAAAHVAFAKADKRYDTALVAVLSTPKGPRQLVAYKAFVLAAQRKQQADARYVRLLAADQRFRASHPLGRC